MLLLQQEVKITKTKKRLKNRQIGAKILLPKEIYIQLQCLIKEDKLKEIMTLEKDGKEIKCLEFWKHC